MTLKTITKIYKELVNKTTTTLDIIEEVQKKISATKDLNAYISLSNDLSQQAQISQELFNKGKPRSVIEGIPIAVKDNFCVNNVRTTCGSNMLKNFIPKYTATIIDRLLNSGAIFVGKTNLDEFAMGSGTVDSIKGPTKNIWRSKDGKNWHICGGSSGGSAVAVASGTCLGALGSDTGGSTRNPASYCGIVGLKPTYGLVSRFGLIPLVNSMDVPGILATNVEDTFTLLKIIAGPDYKDSTTVKRDVDLGTLSSEPSVKGLKIGIPVEYNCEGLTDEVKNVWERIAKLLEKGGAEVKTVSMPHTKYSIVCYSVLNQCEVASNMAKYDGVEFGTRSNNPSSSEEMFADTRSKNFNLVVRRRILAGNYFLLGSNYEKYFLKALKIRRLISNDFLEIWNRGYNILLTPTTLSDAPEYENFIKQDEREQCASQDYCTQPANMSGCPAISVPVDLSQKGLPLSIQLMAPNFQDKTLLKVALYVEKHVEFNKMRDESLH